MTGPAPLLALSGITKRYGATLANDAVDLEVEAGTIQALLGENGAGKSTLVKIVYGAVQPDAGGIVWQGSPVRIASPREARRLGIGMVFQHFTLVEALSVLENVALAQDGAAADGRLAGRVKKLARRYRLAVDPARPVHALSVGERQRVEIVRCLLQDPRLLIMDEPTSVLAPPEIEPLFATLRALAVRGCAILYISHKLDEVRSLCGSATVLRGGRVVARLDPRQETARSLARAMVGADVREVRRVAGRTVSGAPRLEVDGLAVAPADAHAVPLDRIGFAVHAGEILGIAGVAGNGQSELLAALSGERPTARGTIRLDGRAVQRHGPAARRARGLCYVPEERLGTGAVAGFSLGDNTVLAAWRRARLVGRGVIRRGAARDFAASIIDLFKVRGGAPAATAASLSGGNLQKFIMGREMLQQPGVLIAAQPTWGVDAAATAAIRSGLVELARGGAAVLLVSQDLDEILAIADRIAVLSGGRLTPPRPVAGVTLDEIGLAMGGAAAPPAVAA